MPRLLCVHRFSVRAAYVRACATLQAGGTVIFASLDQVPALLRAGMPNWLLLLVGDLSTVVAEAAPLPEGFSLHVEAIGARVERGLRHAVRERLRASLCTTYSSNETNVVSYTDDNNVGTLCAGAAARIVDEQGHERAPGEIGLIRVRTATMVDRYWNDPARTAAAFIDGWYHTNDVGYIPEPGKLVVLGRSDDMLNIGGIKLPPGPLEDEIRRLPNVRDAALLTQDDGAAAGLVVAVELASPCPVNSLLASVAPLVRRHVPAFDLLAFPSFPRTETGKIRRAELVAAVKRRNGHQLPSA